MKAPTNLPTDEWVTLDFQGIEILVYRKRTPRHPVPSAELLAAYDLVITFQPDGSARVYKGVMPLTFDEREMREGLTRQWRQRAVDAKERLRGMREELDQLRAEILAHKHRLIGDTPPERWRDCASCEEADRGLWSLVDDR